MPNRHAPIPDFNLYSNIRVLRPGVQHSVEDDQISRQHHEQALEDRIRVIASVDETWRTARELAVITRVTTAKAARVLAVATVVAEMRMSGPKTVVQYRKRT